MVELAQLALVVAVGAVLYVTFFKPSKRAVQRSKARQAAHRSMKKHERLRSV